MLLPKKLMINHRTWTVKKDKSQSGANFSYSDTTMHIGTQKNSDREVLANFIHEVAEISCVERGVRSEKSMLSNESNDYVFVANHARFSDVMNDISRAVGDVMRLK
jgi:hypothetical protein